MSSYAIHYSGWCSKVIFPPLLQVWWPGPSLQSRPPASARQLAARLSVVGGREGGTTLASWQEAHWRIVRHVLILTDRKLSCKKKRHSNCLQIRQCTVGFADNLNVFFSCNLTFCLLILKRVWLSSSEPPASWPVWCLPPSLPLLTVSRPAAWQRPVAETGETDRATTPGGGAEISLYYITLNSE